MSERINELIHKLNNEGLTDEENEEYRELVKQTGKDLKRELKITLDTSPEYKNLERYKRYFEEDVDMVMRKAKKYGIETERPTDKMELALLVGTVRDKERSLEKLKKQRSEYGSRATGQTPLGSQYGISEYSDSTPLKERTYDSYEELIQDLRSAEKQTKNPELSKQARKIIRQLFAKEVKQVKEGHGYGHATYMGEITKLQKTIPKTATDEEVEDYLARIRKELRKWKKA